jgi:glycosyltransferase involved in cell wall biosynthesis
MNSVSVSLFYVSAFIIFWAMIGYPLSLKVLGRLFKNRTLKKDYDHLPTVTVMVVAHNEEKVILKKLNNLLEIAYPKEKIAFILASDNSVDQTNELTKSFMAQHPDFPLSLYEAKERKGKTNAQNEAQKMVKTEFLVMTDANAQLDQKAVIELMAAFSAQDIAYVTGKLTLINSEASNVSGAETNYWDSDLAIREIEGRIQTITAGNGALYACRNADYHDFNPIHSHDSAMPVYYALQGKRAIANHDALAYEKAGENIGDEFNRKVRMYRDILQSILPDVRMLNIFKYRWFSYFYFGHRSCRYLLWIAHLVVLITNFLLIEQGPFFLMIFLGQILFYCLSGLGALPGLKNSRLKFFYYYTATILAQWLGVYRILTGKAKPFWEKAESTR